MSSSNNNAIQMPTPPLTPKTISRFDSNPYPTTFVQADTSTFKQVVQMLAGSSDSIKQASQVGLDQYELSNTTKKLLQQADISSIENLILIHKVGLIGNKCII